MNLSLISSLQSTVLSKKYLKRYLYVRFFLICKIIAVLIFLKICIQVLSNRQTKPHCPSASDCGYYVKQCGCWKHLDRSFFNRPKNYLSRCSQESTFYGPNQKVISYSLYNFNESSRYSIGLLPNLEAMRRIYPGWVMRLYTDYPLKRKRRGSVDYCEIVCNSDDFFWCDAREIPDLGDITSSFAMTWRFIPVADPLVDIFISRDIDSRLTQREKNAVGDWIDSDKMLHFMRDNPEHFTPVLGGMWGLKTSQVNPEDAKHLQWDILDRGRFSNKKGLDQKILREVFYVAKYFDKAMAHDSNYCRTFNKTLCIPFPNELDASDEFVGNAVYEN